MPQYSSFGLSGVASRVHLATYAGLKVLEDGGNAFDAAITISSVLSVLIPHLGGLGGDGFLLAVLENGEVVAYNGSGRSPKGFNAEEFLKVRPVRGPLTVTVPGLVDLWGWISEDFSTRKLSELLRKAVALSEGGHYVLEQLYLAVERFKGELAGFEGWVKLFGQLRRGGFVRYPGLAEVLRVIGERGAREFYEGRLAEEVTEALSREGVPVSLEDFRTHRGFESGTVTTQYGEYEVHELPPNTQGLTTLELLKLAELTELNKEDLRSPSRLVKFLQLAAVAYRDRDTKLGDPDHSYINVREFTDPEYLSGKLSTAEEVKVSNSGDTTFFVVADRRGNLVGFIQSIFHPFGSGIVVKDMPFQNRGVGFALGTEVPNAPAPMKRPLHTLSILLARRDGEDVMIGCAGGDLRPQIHAEVLTNLIDYGMELSKAVNAPRYMLLEWGEELRAVVEEGAVSGELPEWVDVVPYDSGRVGVVHAARRVKGGLVEFVADVRGGGVAAPLLTQ